MITTADARKLDRLVANPAFIRRCAELAAEHGTSSVIESLMQRAKLGREAATVAVDIAITDAEERELRETFNA